jgi:hypothetical protein
LIPKVFHRIWLGGKPMPEPFVAWGQSWLDLNPGWAMKTWTEETLPTSEHPESVANACHLSQRSNVYRYEILKREGGVYLDADFLALRPLDGLFNRSGAFVVERTPGRASCAILGCEAGHPLAVDLVAQTPARDPGKSMSLGSSFLRDTMAHHADVPHIASESFFPVRHFEWRQLFNGDAPKGSDELCSLFPRAFAVHFWADKWFLPSFQPIG